MRTFEEKARSRGFARIAGTDEAGRGPLAGPVVSAAVILPSGFSDSRITDSKKLTPKKREQLCDLISAHAEGIGIGIVESGEIDRINILRASLKSMYLAVTNLSPLPDYLLIDGKFAIPFCNLPQKALIRGDSLSISIAAASIVAKVTRDRLMEDYHETWPQYGFHIHKGYPTKAHRDAVAAFGPCPIHRVTFRGVREYVR
ncbi:MAG: ribonuclease HII [Desulfobacterales bacterium]